jgi:catechol 2,3-dioxygenase-like lactoylglutathione lyase family enzyme
MSVGLDVLLTRYENGSLSRRDLLGALGALVAAGTAASSSMAAAATTVGPVKQMNHVSIFVPDVQKSKQFYQDVFGLPLLTNQDPGVNLSTGPSFLGIYPMPANAQGGKASINHLCLGVENFEADAVLKSLTERGIQARIRQRGDTKELYMTDPDGISVQLQDTKYIGGSGVLGDKK